jgi:large subunit ribosomal protein L10Ae
MSKISSEGLVAAVDQALQYSLHENKRGFVETIELQVSLKNYDVGKDKKFAGTIKLPKVPREKFSVCILGNEKHIEEAKSHGIPAMSVVDLEKLKKDKKLVKKLAQKYHAFLASTDLIKRIPRLLGPGLNRAGKFPTVLGNNESIVEKVEELKSSIKFQLKGKALCLAVPVANVGMTKDEILTNLNMSINFLVSLLKKGWQNVRRMYIKTSMGPPLKVFGF